MDDQTSSLVMGSMHSASSFAPVIWEWEMKKVQGLLVHCPSTVLGWALWFLDFQLGFLIEQEWMLSNHYVVQLKLMQYCLSTTSQPKLGKSAMALSLEISFHLKNYSYMGVDLILQCISMSHIDNCHNFMSFVTWKEKFLSI